MNLKPLLLGTLMCAVSGLVVAAEAGKDAKKPAAGVLCPLSGEPAKLSVKKTTDSGPVFFCCKDCIKEYEADPAKYEAKVKQQHEALAFLPKKQENCPLSGKPAKDDIVVEHDGQKVHFCCHNCEAKYKADPAKFEGKVLNSFTYYEAPKCPVSGKPADMARMLTTADGAVYFCCPGCEKAYKADPDKYSEKVAEQRKLVAMMDRVQVTCPLSGKPVNAKQFSEKGGEKVYFCCENCKGKYEADPAKYKDKLEGTYSYQTLCPVTNEQIDPKAFVELADGRKVYFCCSDCKEKLLSEPAKYAPNLEKQNVRADADKIKAKPAT
jgi:YHS domain-containing protein